MSVLHSQEKRKTASGSKGRPQIDPELCKGCELCVAACPQSVLHMSERTNSQGNPYPEYDGGVCTACKACAIVCPDNAIEIYKFESGD